MPKHIDEQRVMDAIAVEKDADGLTAVNLGQLSRPSGQPLATPCTPAGCLELLRRHHVDLSGKECVILGRSAIVGMPMVSWWFCMSCQGFEFDSILFSPTKTLTIYLVRLFTCTLVFCQTSIPCPLTFCCDLG